MLKKIATLLNIAMVLTLLVNSNIMNAQQEEDPQEFNFCEQPFPAAFSVTGYDKYVNYVKFYIEDNLLTFGVGTFKGFYFPSEGSPLQTRYYCVDPLTLIGGWNTEPIYSTTGTYVDIYVRYIVNAFYPKNEPVLSEEKEAAAVQFAIWHFTNGLELNSTNILLKGSGNQTDIDQIIERAQVIVQSAFDNASEWIFSETIGFLLIRTALFAEGKNCENSQTLVLASDPGDDPLPVELTSFDAAQNENSVVLIWETATELNNYGFEIERNGEKVGFVPGNGNSNSPLTYSFKDNAVVSGNHSYRLKQIDFDGKFEYSEVIKVEVTAPETFELAQNYPNPFNPTTSIKYSISDAGLVRLAVYNILGEEVALLINETKEAGIYNVTFDASNLNSGIYIYKLESGNKVEMQKMMLVK